jgi:hypothetical protein
MNGGAVTAAGIQAQWRAERQRAKRFERLETIRDALAAGRGRRAALANKVKQATVLMLMGKDADTAAAAAGLKASASSGRGMVTVAGIFLMEPA